MAQNAKVYQDDHGLYLRHWGKKIRPIGHTRFHAGQVVRKQHHYLTTKVDVYSLQDWSRSESWSFEDKLKGE